MNLSGARGARVIDALTHGRGTIDTIAAWFPLEIGLVRSMVPRGLSVTPDAQGRALAWVLSSAHHYETWFGQLRYFELTLGFANVELGDGHAGSYLRRLYLDEAVPRVLGRAIYGFEKLGATIRWDRDDGRDRYIVEARRARTIFDARFEPAKEFSVAGLAKTWAVLEQPVVSQAARRFTLRAALDHGAPFLHTDVRFDSGAAKLRAVRGRIEFGSVFDPPELAGLAFDVGPLDADGFGAVAWQTGEVVTLPRRA